MIFWNKFCGLVLFLLITGLCSPAQNTTLSLRNKFNNSLLLLHFIPPVSIVTNLQHVRQMIPADFYTCNIGFFCKKELLIERATKIPLRLRVGSLQQCNYYEGKKQ